MATRSAWTPMDPGAHRAQINAISALLRHRFSPVEGLAGESTVLGQMPDWNPAEMIGSFPGALARSLYERLITDSVWRRARASMGYGDAFPHRLMIHLADRPYVDVRCSANNLLPADLEAPIAERVVNAGLARLRQHPELHDKIEFEVFPTCFDFDLDVSFERLAEHALKAADEGPLRSGNPCTGSPADC